MKIAHIGLACFFTEGMTYQDNQLSHQNAMDGNTVLYISNAAKYVDGKTVITGYDDRVLPDGVRLVRLPYEHIVNRFLSDKLRKVKGLYGLLEDFAPDVILSHDLCYWSVLDVIRYKKAHPQVKLYSDSHADDINSGTNWISLHIQHRLIYRSWIQQALPYLEKHLVLSEETRQFNRDNYGVPESLMEFYPLGGNLPTENEYTERRTRRRSELSLEEQNILFVHSGKLDALKRTEELLKAFLAVPNQRFRLAVIGSIPENMKSTLEPLLSADSRVKYLGWKSADELLEYLCAADVYCQPGSQSATMQNAVCCGCAIMLYPQTSYVKDFDWQNIVWVKSQTDMEQMFRDIANGGVDLQKLKENSNRCANELLDYRKLAARLYR